MVVEIEKTVSVDGKTIRYRFDSPFAYECTGQDELGGYIGYPYIDNDENFFISDGLQNCNMIVASGVHHLTDGQKVSVMKKSSCLNVGNLK